MPQGYITNKDQIERIKTFNRILKDKKIIKIKIEDFDFKKKYILQYEDGQIFKCSGLIPNNSEIYSFDKNKFFIKKKKIF